MDAEQILAEFTYSRRLPVEAIRAADADRARMLPIFLQEIESYLAMDAAARPARNPLFLIFHILGSWREPAAYRSLAKLLRLPGGEIGEVVGEDLTEIAHRVMAGVFDGDPEPLFEVILDPQADEFARSMMFDALLMAMRQDRLPKGTLARFVRRCHEDLRPRETCYVWTGWQRTVAALGLVDMTEQVREVFDRGFVDPFWDRFERFEEDVLAALDGRLRPEPKSLFGDTIEELSGWHCFSEPETTEVPSATSLLPALARVLAGRKRGRNDPCGCGSGLKYKKCCLGKVRTGAGGPQPDLIVAP